MKKFFKAIAFCVVLSMLLTACSAESGDIETNDTAQALEDTTVSSINVENPDFRKVKWGMSKDEVIAIEGEPTREIDDSENNFYGLIKLWKNY